MAAYEQSPTSPGDEGGGMKERASEVVAEADAGASHVAHVAGDEARSVAHEAKSAARTFFDETRTQLQGQAATQQHRAGQALRAAGDQLSEMAQGASSDTMASGLVRGLGSQTQRVGAWLDEREPADLVREVRGFARRHTGAFLVIAAGIGVVAGRLTRALTASGDNGAGSSSGGLSVTRADGGRPAALGAEPAGVPAGQAPIGDALAGDGRGANNAPVTGGTGLVDETAGPRDPWSPGEQEPR